MSLKSLLGGAAPRPRMSAPVPYTSRYAPLAAVLGGLGGVGERSLNRREQLEMYDCVGTLFGIVSKLASTTSLVNWKFYKTAPSGDPDERQELPANRQHAARNVWNRPNMFMTRQEYVEGGQQHVDLTGDGFNIVVRGPGGIPLELWPVRPDRMTIVPSVQEFIAGYVYTSPDGETVPLRREDVMTMRWPSPLDIYRGSSPLPALSADVANERAQSQWSASFFRNSAMPGGVVELDVRLEDEEFDELVDKWNRSHRGVNNAGRVAFLEQGKFTPVTYTQKDMQFVELRGVTKQAFLDAYGFPKFGLGDVADVNRASAQASKEYMAESLTVPRLERWKAMLNNDFLPMFGETAVGYEFDYDNPVPLDQETDNDTLGQRVTAYVALLGAGVDPEEAAAACELPNMTVTPKEVPSVPAVPPAVPAAA